MTLRELRARFAAYVAHDDPATAAANLVATVVGGDTPLYPIYVIYVAGWSYVGAAALVALGAPVFLAVPAIARRSSRLARFTLPVFGTVNTLWCVKLLGTACGLRLFLLPCVVLATLLHRREERPLLALAIALAVAADFLPDWLFTPAIAPLDAASARHLTAINQGSALLLCAVIAWQVAAALRERTA